VLITVGLFMIFHASHPTPASHAVSEIAVYWDSRPDSKLVGVGVSFPLRRCMARRDRQEPGGGLIDPLAHE